MTKSKSDHWTSTPRESSLWWFDKIIEKQGYHSEMGGSPVLIYRDDGNMVLWDRKS